MKHSNLPSSLGLAWYPASVGSVRDLALSLIGLRLIVMKQSAHLLDTIEVISAARILAEGLRLFAVTAFGLSIAGATPSVAAPAGRVSNSRSQSQTLPQWLIGNMSRRSGSATALSWHADGSDGVAVHILML
jgi:hypothetical protein